MVVGGRPAGGHRHEVRDLPDPLLGQEAGDQDGRVGEIQLLGRVAGSARADPEMPAPLLVEQRPEDGRRVDPRAAEPVHRAVGGDQGRGLQVTDQPMVGDRRIGLHNGPPLARKQQHTVTCRALGTVRPRPHTRHPPGGQIDTTRRPLQRPTRCGVGPVQAGHTRAPSCSYAARLAVPPLCSDRPVTPARTHHRRPPGARGPEIPTVPVGSGRRPGKGESVAQVGGGTCSAHLPRGAGGAQRESVTGQGLAGSGGERYGKSFGRTAAGHQFTRPRQRRPGSVLRTAPRARTPPQGRNGPFRRLRLSDDSRVDDAGVIQRRSR